MARALVVVHKRPGDGQMLESWAATLNRRLTPDNLRLRNPWLAREPGITTIVFSPNDTVRVRGTSVLLGMPIGPADRWHVVGTQPPDGSYGLLRSDERRVELIADATASRTIWYTETPRRFIASTSQRAIVMLLGGFELNTEAVPWMLSTGTLGPAGGWDARIEPVLPGECVTLDRARWRVGRQVEPVVFMPSQARDAGVHAKRLADTVERVGARLSFDPQRWLLPLSGGVDSRGLLALLHEREGIRTFTWGLESARRRLSNDANIAAKVASAFDVDNRFLSSEVSMESPSRLVRRFLVAGEGRIANIPPFLDGFSVWRKLFDEGVDGILRGDQGFGTTYVRDARDVRRVTKLETLEDHFAPEDVASFELPRQVLPPRLARRPDESLATWAHRLYQQNRLPKMLAGLTDLKSPYVEVVNPLLAREILEVAASLPDALRTDKRLWYEYVRERSSGIPFARRVAVLPLRDFLKRTAMLELMLGKLTAERDSGVLSPALVERISAALRSVLQTPEASRVGTRTCGPLALIVPHGIRTHLRRWYPHKRVLLPTELAFRVHIVYEMRSLLEADGRALTPDMRRAASL